MSEKGCRTKRATASLLIATIKGYRKFISPAFPSSCIYNPTCSVYAETAIKRYGVIRGLKLATLRLLRCHPFRQGGYDPVPDKWENRK
ncbi:MAG: membrane protein insertion efficiency factor YidD [Deltaproteobacteria bacterium]|nr:membrane protein insertion efficiency factor YidD [Deltaproteobacteria bacterium]RKZ11247.1 MAG: membrane protein insertion efficiency factor YidD [Candidatus Fermentibacteria bacterium]